MIAMELGEIFLGISVAEHWWTASVAALGVLLAGRWAEKKKDEQPA